MTLNHSVKFTVLEASRARDVFLLVMGIATHRRGLDCALLADEQRAAGIACRAPGTKAWCYTLIACSCKPTAAPPRGPLFFFEITNYVLRRNGMAQKTAWKNRGPNAIKSIQSGKSSMSC
ncbi:MAG: hypothetical protein WBG18_18125 [Xanthobacteraceae bacterium]